MHVTWVGERYVLEMGSARKNKNETYRKKMFEMTKEIWVFEVDVVFVMFHFVVLFRLVFGKCQNRPQWKQHEADAQQKTTKVGTGTVIAHLVASKSRKGFLEDLLCQDFV